MSKTAVFKVFVVEDDAWYRDFLAHILSLNPAVEVKTFATGSALLQALPEQPHTITLDYLLPDLDGSTLLRRIREFDEHIPVIIISEQDKVHTAVDLLREGAYDYLEKTEAVKDRLLHMLLQIQKNHQLQSRLRKLQQEVQEKYDFSATLLGKSDSIRSVFSLLEKAIGNNIPVLITGETGTGKELVAKALHQKYHGEKP